jgi:hypothetical protein
VSPRFLAALRGVAWLTVALMLLYLVGLNLFLQTRWFQDAISYSPEEFRVDYARAYSLLPGRVHVQGLEIRGSDSSIQWILKLDSCDFSVRFPDLLRRRFHAYQVRGEGFSMRVRMRLEEDEVRPEIVSALPPVPGFSDPPLLLVGPPKAPLTDADYKLWSIELDDVVAEHVRELWIHTLRYAGDFRVRGRWLFRPVRWLEVGPATIDVGQLDVSNGLRPPLLAAARGTIDCTVHPYDVRAPHGAEILDQVSAKTSLSGSLDAVALFAFLAPEAPFRLAPGERLLDLALTLDHGVLQPGSHAATASAPAGLVAAGLSFGTQLATELRVDGGDGGPVGHVLARASALRVRDGGTELARAALLSFEAASPHLDLGHETLEGATFASALRGGEAPSVAFLRAVLPPGVSVNSGVVSAEAHVDGLLDEQTGRGALTLSVRDLSMINGPVEMRANGRADVTLEAGSLREERAELVDGRIAFEGLSGAVSGVPFSAPRLSLTAPRLVVARAGPRGTVTLDVPAAELPDLRSLAARASLPETVRVTRGSASGSVHMDADLTTLEARGKARVQTRGLRVEVGHDTYEGDLVLAVQARPRAGASRTTDLSGSTLAFTSVAAPSAESWWARASLHFAELRLQGRPRLSATVHLDAQNAAPVQALLARTTPVPRWVLDAFPTDHLRADGEILWEPSSLVARNVRAESQGTSIRLEYAKHQADKEGLALVSSGGLRLGLTLAGEGRGLTLFGAEGWYARRVQELRARASAW